MINLLQNAVLVAADAPGGTGENPDNGIFIILGIVFAVALLGLLGHVLVHRFGRSRPEAMRRRPAKDGRVGRVSEFRKER
jgi:hypothetical protein